MLTLLVAGAASAAAAETSVPTLPARIVSAADRTEHRRFVLANALRVLLRSGPSSERSAAGLAVGVGRPDDPPEHQGTAHFLEHRLFLGTTKYPQHDGDANFLRVNDGTQTRGMAGVADAPVKRSSDGDCSHLQYGTRAGCAHVGRRPPGGD